MSQAPSALPSSSLPKAQIAGPPSGWRLHVSGNEAGRRTHMFLRLEELRPATPQMLGFLCAHPTPSFLTPRVWPRKLTIFLSVLDLVHLLIQLAFHSGNISLTVCPRHGGLLYLKGKIILLASTGGPQGSQPLPTGNGHYGEKGIGVASADMV